MSSNVSRSHSRRLQDDGDPRAALERRELAGLVGLAVRLGHQRADRALLDAALAERREDLLDVADERLVRADDEHAFAAELRVGVQQPGGAVQADGRLPGAGAALDDERAFGVARDQLVLVGRDRRDDLAHLADALARDVLDDRVGEVVLELRVERLVDEAEHLALLDVQAAPPSDAVRVLLGRGVERLGGGGAPVDREQVVGRAVDGVAADVERVAVGAVDAAEVQRAARFGVHADALPAHRLERFVGVVVAAV